MDGRLSGQKRGIHMSNKVLQAKSLESLLRKLSDEWYDAVDGSYEGVPTFGPRTAIVAELIRGSCAEGDIVSWDTRADDPAEHRYIMRRWTPALASQPNGSEHEFQIVDDEDSRISGAIEHLEEN
jgi:hypothetical protein